VLLVHANNASGEFAGDIARILSDATGLNPSRRLWISSVLFAELRPSSFRPGAFAALDDLVRYIRSIATVVNPDPYTMLRAAQLRDFKWSRSPSKRAKDEKTRCMTLGDAIHIASALYVKEAMNVPDLEFLTFDNSSDKSVETDPDTKSLPLLALDEYTHDISGDPDVYAVVSLPRIRPVLRQSTLPV
jgi:hypothetical protein